MKANPILEEVWRIKDQLAAEATYDVDRFFGQLRAWSEAHPHAAPVVRNAEELRRLATGESALALRGQAAAQGLMLLPAGCIPGPAGSRLHGLEGVRTTPAIRGFCFLLSTLYFPAKPPRQSKSHQEATVPGRPVRITLRLRRESRMTPGCIMAARRLVLPEICTPIALAGD